MVGFGSNSCSSSSAFSNLSPLAPPFSIDRSNPNKLHSNPIPPFSEFNSIPPQYSQLTCAVEPFSHTWQYTQPSAPRSQLIADSVLSISMPTVPSAADGFKFSASTSPSNAYWSEPFYSPYVPPRAGEEDPLREDNGPRYDEVPPQTDYMQGLYDLEYGPPWIGAKMGSSYRKDANEVELNGSLLSGKPNSAVSHGYNNQLIQGHGTEYGSNYKEGTGVSCERFSLVSDSDLHPAYTGTRHMEDKPCLEQNPSLLPPDFSNKHTSAASSTLLASRPLGLSSETHNNLSDYHQNTCSENKDYFRPVGSPFTRPVSTVRSSPAVVIRPPPVASGVLGQNSVACNDTVGSTVFRDFDLTSLSKINDLNLPNRVNDPIFGSPSVKELSAPLHTKNSLDYDMEARFVSEPSKVNVLDGFSEAQVVATSELSLDSVDRHSLGVDSPCWKGARSLQFSWLDVEDDHFNHCKKNEIYCFDPDKHENISSAMDSTRTSVGACEGNKDQRTECSHDGEVSSSNGAKPEVRISALTRSIGVQINKDLDIPSKDSGISNNLKGGFDMKIFELSNSKDLNYVSDGDIAVHAAEKVLASPSSQDNTPEMTKLEPEPRMDAAMVIEAMHNLSELLMFHQSNDAFILEEKDNETLKLIRSNLDSCLSKKIIQPINGTNLDHAVGDTSKLGDSHNVACPNMVNIAKPEGPQKTGELKDSHVPRDYWSMYEEEYDNSGNKDEKSPVFSPLRNDLDLTKDDLVAKGIKKVLDENFNFDEEMLSQAHLFKSLWLEAEAKLCSISYRARFERMKLEMENLKPKAPIGKENVVEMLPKVDISPKINIDAKLIHREYDGSTAKSESENSSLPSITMHTDATETSVMTRFSILKSREDSVKPTNDEEKHPDIVDADSAGSVMDRFSILKSRLESSKSFILDEEKTPKISSAGFADQNHVGTCIKDHNASQEKLNSSVANDPMIHSFYDSSRMMNQQYSLWRGSSSSSDWEHVMKDDFAWKNS